MINQSAKKRKIANKNAANWIIVNLIAPKSKMIFCWARSMVFVLEPNTARAKEVKKLNKVKDIINNTTLLDFLFLNGLYTTKLINNPSAIARIIASNKARTKFIPRTFKKTKNKYADIVRTAPCAK
tara:strand:+ start:4529 stop:4906 length:378 start_codon:yes stop_codon:yes gene_type:complete